MPASRFKRFARAVARPLTSPIDGRVEDINRRVGDVGRHVGDLGESLHDLERGVAANVATVTESNAYLGVALRRFEGELNSLREHVDEHERRVGERIDALADRQYVERLARAEHMPLAELDGALAGAINHATGHRGFAAQAGLWFNQPITVELGEGAARIGSVNERIVELPFALGALATLAPGARVLDVGGAESTLALSAACLGYDVTVVDPRPIAFEHPRLTQVTARLEDWDAAPGRFHAAFLVSTVEHIGLGAYGEGGGPADADRKALLRVAELLTDDGLLVLSTPFGAAHVDAFERVYDEAGLDALLAGWNVLERRFAVRRDARVWESVERIGGAQAGVAMVLARPARSAAEPDPPT